MALSADEAQPNCADVDFNAVTPKVNILPKLKKGDFVLIHWRGDAKLAKILDIIDGKVHIHWYLRVSQLPEKCELIDANGEPIELDENHEVIENGTELENVDKKLIFCKCHLIYAQADISPAAVLQQRAKPNAKMYVCRFKLVKKTVYRLEPIDWHREELNNEYGSVADDTGTEDEREDLSVFFRKIELSERKRKSRKHNGTDENRSKLVSPIKIVNGDVHKVKRQTNNDSEEKIDDVNVSPTKRGKFVDERNGNYLMESPKSGDKIRSYSRNVSKARKNLNTSFLETSFDTDNNNDSVDETASYSIESMDTDQTMKMTFRKNSAQTPLKELNDNTNDSPTHNLRKQVLHKTVAANVTPATTPGKSILKNGGDSAKNTPKRGRDAVEKMAAKSPEPIAATSTKMQTRRSVRLSSFNASAKNTLVIEDQSPEPVRGKPKTSKTSRSKTAQDGCETPRTTGRRSAVPKTPTSVLTPQRKRQLFRSGNLTPSIQSRETAMSTDQNELEMIRERLHVSAVPESLPCRETEFQSIHSFVKDKLNDECGGCIYIAGVPGTGKTATVTQVVRKLQIDAKRNALPKFDYVEINGMRLTEPRQAYVQIYRQLTGKTLAWAQARDLLEKRFTDPRSMAKKRIRSTILLIDELDIICNRKQDVVYNLFDWTSKRGSRLVAITIANTMDLPERVLKLKVASRLGLTRITFQPYSFKQLQEVVMARLAGSNHFVSDAVQLVARKVASVSGDCRRALDICRRATEIAEEMNARNQTVSFVHVNQALNEMFASPRIQAIKCCTKFEKLFLQAVASEITRTGIEEVDFIGVYAQLQILAPVLGIKNPPNQSAALEISLALGASRLLIVEDSRADIYQKIILNVSVDDLHYALNSS